MPAFVPLTTPSQLPAIGAAIERSVMDWKSVDTATTFHKAKDVAAFANHLGGTILVGAAEDSGCLASYVGMAPDKAAAMRTLYSQAVEQRCQPLPRIEFESFTDPTDPGEQVVAINVWPSLLLIGVRIDSHRPAEGYGGASYVYPVRSGIDANYLQPSQLAMYMTPHVRRIAVLLSKIPKGTRVSISSPAGYAYFEYVACIDQVLEEENIVSFVTVDGNKPMRRVPLDRITTVFEDWDSDKQTNVWRVYVELWNSPPPPPRPLGA